MGSNQVTRSGTRRLVIVLATAAVLATGASLHTAYATGGETNDGRGRHRLDATLTGAKERPGPGDPDGRGKARIQLKKNQICFELSWRNIEAPTAAHVHKAPREDPGPVVVGLLDVRAGLGAPVSSVGGCTTADPALIADIRSHPSAYYVNIHNAPFPAGAIRGQLHR